jgi:hypothetical protein
VVFFGLDYDLLDVPLLYAQDLNRFGVAATLFVQFQLAIGQSGLQFADDVLAVDQGVHLVLFQADGQVFDRDLQRQQQQCDDNALLLLVQDIVRGLRFDLDLLVSVIGYLLCFLEQKFIQFVSISKIKIHEPSVL